MINYPLGWFDIEQLPKKLEEKMVDVFIADGSINGLTNYALFTVPVSLDIKEKYCKKIKKILQTLLLLMHFVSLQRSA